MSERDPATEGLEEATIEADEQDAHTQGHPDRMPTAEEERLAEQNELDPHAAEAYKEAAERGANLKGEGEI